MIGHLTEIHRSDWKKLKDLYTSDGSKSYSAYTTIDNYIQWFEQNPSLKHIKFYCLNGDYSDGTFAIVVNTIFFLPFSLIHPFLHLKWNYIGFQDRYCAFADTFNESDENLTRLLELLDFSQGLWFLSIRSRVATVIRAIFKERGIDVPLSNVVRLLLHRLPKEKALEFQIEWVSRWDLIETGIIVFCLLFLDKDLALNWEHWIMIVIWRKWNWHGHMEIRI